MNHGNRVYKTAATYLVGPSSLAVFGLILQELFISNLLYILLPMAAASGAFCMSFRVGLKTIVTG